MVAAIAHVRRVELLINEFPAVALHPSFDDAERSTNAAQQGPVVSPVTVLRKDEPCNQGIDQHLFHLHSYSRAKPQELGSPGLVDAALITEISPLRYRLTLG
ncbi:hypothetical protein HAX54_000790 [Datura stramonium]|uniref:Uncharacterized protein n=1 Tax=Datura stramonium TaxID=4076 RepID=A0ABS8T1I7_DATST|nr:hypothetical protein [Datura stramonium]